MAAGLSRQDHNRGHMNECQEVPGRLLVPRGHPPVVLQLRPESLRQVPVLSLPDLADSARVYVTEGEKGADLARDLGVVATATAHGAKSPHRTDLGPLAGKEVIILPDITTPR